MFTGIITDIGLIRTIEDDGAVRRMVIGSSYPAESIAIGASIAHDGCCLTVTDKGTDADGHWHAVDVSSQTLSCTTLGTWQAGQRVNLERALKAGDELGGHLVSGHVDGVATIAAIRPEGESIHYTIDAPAALAPFIAAKGSVALDGVSLTVTDVAHSPLAGESKRTESDWVGGKPLSLGEVDEQREPGEGSLVTDRSPHPNPLPEREGTTPTESPTALRLPRKGGVGVQFHITLIPHTIHATTWGNKQTGDQLNLEVDQLARYVLRARECGVTMPSFSSYN